MRFPAPRSLHTRVSIVLTLFTGTLLLVLAGFWLQGVRAGIHEEVEAATRVSVQWLTVLSDELRDVPPQALPARVLAIVRPVGRIRANALEVFAADGQRLYQSPPPTYKADQVAPPAWFTDLVTPYFAVRRVIVGDLELVLTPDPSRAVIDAWDDVRGLTGWAVAMLVLLFVLSRYALDRALRPLEQVMSALDRTGHGRFDTRLPPFPVRELGRLSQAFNGMADRLAEAVDQNVRLESEREVARLMQARLEDERRAIARELHDELAQSVTAVRALAGAIVQRTKEQPSLHSPAQSILAVTGEMQDGVRAILHRLRSNLGDDLGAVLERTLANWQGQHPGIVLSSTLALGDTPLADEVAQAVLRVVQEGLTNIVRHAGADRAELVVGRRDGWLTVSLTDNGRGLDGQPSANPGSGLGLAGMGERIALLGGHLHIDTLSEGGLRLVARLPEGVPQSAPEEGK